MILLITLNSSIAFAQSSLINATRRSKQVGAQKPSLGTNVDKILNSNRSYMQRHDYSGDKPINEPFLMRDDGSGSPTAVFLLDDNSEPFFTYLNTNPTNQSNCLTNPTLPGCNPVDTGGGLNPVDPVDPNDGGGVDCGLNPTASVCTAGGDGTEDVCAKDPAGAACLCSIDASSSVCMCAKDPTYRLCNADYCTLNKQDPACIINTCSREPKGKECLCSKDATLDICKSTPVDCNLNPKDTTCIVKEDPCLTNPKADGCVLVDACVSKPYAPGCSTGGGSTGGGSTGGVDVSNGGGYDAGGLGDTGVYAGGGSSTDVCSDLLKCSMVGLGGCCTRDQFNLYTCLAAGNPIERCDQTNQTNTKCDLSTIRTYYEQNTTRIADTESIVMQSCISGDTASCDQACTLISRSSTTQSVAADKTQSVSIDTVRQYIETNAYQLSQAQSDILNQYMALASSCPEDSSCVPADILNSVGSVFSGNSTAQVPTTQNAVQGVEAPYQEPAQTQEQLTSPTNEYSAIN